MKLIETELLCENSRLASLDIESDKWIPFIFDIEQIAAAKSTDDDESAVDIVEKTNLYFKGNPSNPFCINMDYKEFFSMWKQYQSKA